MPHDKDTAARDIAHGDAQRDRLAGPADRMVFKAQRLHVGRVEKVAAIQNQSADHQVMNALPIEEAKLVPIGEDHQRVGSLGRVIRIAARSEVGIESAGVRNCLRVISADARRRPLSVCRTRCRVNRGYRRYRLCVLGPAKLCVCL
jgi:hypothetical protein